MVRNIRKFYYVNLLQKRIQTVHIRGRLSENENIFFENNKNKYLLESKNFNKILEEKTLSGVEKFILEVGFGNGEHIKSLKPENNTFIFGCELYPLGVVLLMKYLYNSHRNDVGIFMEDGRDIIQISKNKIFSKIYTLFPDPWPKKKHNKRRIINNEYLHNLLNILSNDGVIYMATDFKDYADEIEIVLNSLHEKKLKISIVNYKNIILRGGISEMHNEHRGIISTNFAKKAIKEGRDIWIFEIQN